MKNYTLDILNVLSAWLREKGWDVKGSGVADMEDGIYKAAYFLKGKVYPVEVEFTQSKLDTAQRNSEYWPIEKYIRAELERQCDE